MILAVLAFVAFLWSLPTSHVQFFLISLPLGVGAFTAFFLYVRRE